MEIEIYEPIVIGKTNEALLNKIIIFLIAFIISTTTYTILSANQVSSVQAEQLKINNLITNDSKHISNNKTMQRALMVANDNLPENIKRRLYDSNYIIKLQNDLIHVTGGKVTLAQGLTEYNIHKITVVHAKEDNSTNCLLFTQTDSITLLHEIGHAIDKKMISYKDKTYMLLSEDAKFTKAYDVEKYNLFNSDTFKGAKDSYLCYFRIYKEEYFAECFALYYNSNESRNILKTHAPQTYQFIKNYVDK